MSSNAHATNASRGAVATIRSLAAPSESPSRPCLRSGQLSKALDSAAACFPLESARERQQPILEAHNLPNMQFFEDKKKELEAWVKSQPPQVEVGLVTAGGAAQGEKGGHALLKASITFLACSAHAVNERRWGPGSSHGHFQRNGATSHARDAGTGEGGSLINLQGTLHAIAASDSLHPPVAAAWDGWRAVRTRQELCSHDRRECWIDCYHQKGPERR